VGLEVGIFLPQVQLLSFQQCKAREAWKETGV
jgi:hypothetical protein